MDAATQTENPVVKFKYKPEVAIKDLKLLKALKEVLPTVGGKIVKWNMPGIYYKSFQGLLQTLHDLENKEDAFDEQRWIDESLFYFSRKETMKSAQNVRKGIPDALTKAHLKIAEILSKMSPTCDECLVQKNPYKEIKEEINRWVEEDIRESNFNYLYESEEDESEEDKSSVNEEDKSKKERACV